MQLRETVQFLSRVVCMDNTAWFSLNVKVSAPLNVTGLGNRQIENGLKFCITRMIYRMFLLITNISTPCVILMIKRHSDTRNEFSDVKLARKHVL